jgi:hypothetical protein
LVVVTIMPIRDEVSDPGKIDVLEEDRIDRQRTSAAEQQRVAVGFRRRDGFQGDRGAAARPVIDDHRLPKQRGELLPDLSRDDVDSAAGQERDDDPDRSARIRLCGSGAGGAESDRCDHGQQDAFADHSLLPVLRLDPAPHR